MDMTGFSSANIKTAFDDNGAAIGAFKRILGDMLLALIDGADRKACKGNAELVRRMSDRPACPSQNKP